MNNEKAEIVKIEIMEGLGEDLGKDRSIFILFCMFIGYFIKNIFSLIKIFFKGLWRFIKYGYYRFGGWCDELETRKKACEK